MVHACIHQEFNVGRVQEVSPIAVFRSREEL